MAVTRINTARNPHNGARNKGAQAAADGFPRTAPYVDQGGGIGMNRSWLAGYDDAVQRIRDAKQTAIPAQ